MGGVDPVVGRDRLLGELCGAEAHLFADDKVKEAGQRHQPQPAQLDEADDDRLAADIKVGVGVIDDQSGYAGSRSGGKKRVYKRGDNALAVEDGQHQQQRSHEDQDSEAGDNDKSGVFEDNGIPPPVQRKSDRFQFEFSHFK